MLDWLKENLPAVIGLVLGLLLALGVIELPEGYSLEEVVAILSGFVIFLLTWLLGGSAYRAIRKS